MKIYLYAASLLLNAYIGHAATSTITTSTSVSTTSTSKSTGTALTTSSSTSTTTSKVTSTSATTTLLTSTSSTRNVTTSVASSTSILSTSSVMLTTSSVVTSNTTSTARPSVSSSATVSNTTSATSTPSATPTYAPVSGKNLRIMGLGDSITRGWGSSTGNGWRYSLLNLLSQNGTNNTVTFVGGVQSGNVSTPFVEGFDGATIGNISNLSVADGLPRRPNVVLLHAGTNDMLLNYSVADAPTRLSSLIDQVFQICTDATVIVAQIIDSSEPGTHSRIVPYNTALPAMVQTHISKGRRILMVDQWTPFNVSTMLWDQLHPNDFGYAQMASVWYNGLQQAASKGWLDSAPVPTNLSPRLRREWCLSNPVWLPSNSIQGNVGLGANKHAGINCTAVANSNTTCACFYFDGTNRTLPLSGPSCSTMSTSFFNSVQLADLNGDGLADYIFIKPDASVYAAYSTGSGWGSSMSNFACCTGARPEEVFFADLTGDGRAEYIWIHPDGTIEAWWNTVYGWSYLGVVMQPQSNMPGAGIRFVDLDGDGLADWLYVDPLTGGAVTAFKNAGRTNNTFSWTSLGMILYGRTDGSRETIGFADLNGDGFNDLLVFNRTTGAIDVGWNWINTPWAYGQLVYWPGGVLFPGFGSGFDVSSLYVADMTGDGRSEVLTVGTGDGSIIQSVNWC